MTEDAFLAAILARYHDDGPRLILADYLAESSNPSTAARADFIRVQLALARLSPEHPRWPVLNALQVRLLQEHQHDWAGSLAGIASAVEFRRGLLDSIAIDARRFLDVGEELFRLAPIRRVRLLEARACWDRLADCTALRHLRELDLCSNDLGSGGLAILLRSPHLTQLRHLDLSFTGLDDSAMALLARSVALPRLRQLLMTDNGAITGEAITSLAESRSFARLVTLDLSGNAINERGVRALVSTQGFPRLRHLAIHANPLGDSGVAMLANAPPFARFAADRGRLNLRNTQLSPAGAIALASAAWLSRISRLDLSGNELGNQGLAAMAYSPHLPRLRHLSVRNARIYDDGAALLAYSPLMTRLAQLDIAENYLSSRAITWLYLKRRNWKTVLETSGNTAVADGHATTEHAGEENQVPQAARIEQLRRRYVPREFWPSPGDATASR